MSDLHSILTLLLQVQLWILLPVKNLVSVILMMDTWAAVYNIEKLVYSNIHDSFQEPYLNVSRNIPLGSQVNYFPQGQKFPVIPPFGKMWPGTSLQIKKFWKELADICFVNLVPLNRLISRHLLCEPSTSEWFNNQDQQMLGTVNSLSSLVGATGTSMSASQQGYLNPLYQIGNEGILSSGGHIVPSSWGTSSHLVQPVHGVELQNNVYGVPSFCSPSSQEF